MPIIGFIGLGHMGQPMAQNLLTAGFKMHVLDLDLRAMQTAINAGAIAAETAVSLAKNCDVIFTMLQTGDQVSSVCLGDAGIFSHAKKNLLYIDCSSIEITHSHHLHTEAANAGIAMLDAPVSGGVNGAKNATLTIMVGGESTHVSRALPLFEKMGKKIIHAGPAGNGQAAKICNNLILGVSMIAVCEGFILGKKLGLDPKTFFDISSNASGQCWSMTRYCPEPGILPDTPSSHHYQPGFPAKMMLKDLRLAQHAAESVAAAIPLAAEAAELFALYAGQGDGDLDFSGIYNLIAGHSKK